MVSAAFRAFGRAIPLRWRNRIRAFLIRRETVQRFRSQGENFQMQTLESSYACACRFCGKSDALHDVIGNVPVTHHGAFKRMDYRLVRCGACNVVYLDPDPPLEDLRLIYELSDQFTSEHYAAEENADRITQSYGRRLDVLGLVPNPGKTLLEVGAGRAWMSKACKMRSTAIATIAQDISTECAQSCPWVDDYRIGPIESALSGVTADLISLTHVIEHVSNPAHTLMQLIRHLCSGGSIYIIAPYRPPLWQPADGLKPWLAYSYLHVPAHISYLSKEWFDQFASIANVTLAHWDDTHDAYQVFEAVLTKT
jgi:2-polyprenyl-3-methyl-5-hydroxy-6-metoxy-1,4-benzoquinol methylase